MTARTVSRTKATKQAGHTSPVASNATSCQDARMQRESKARRMTPAEGLKRARETGKVVSIPYGQGLNLACTPNGAASWRWRYRFNDRIDAKVLGRHPHMNAQDAMAARLKLGQLLRQGIDPKTVQQATQVAGVTFTQVADRWVKEAAIGHSWSQPHRAKVERTLAMYVLPKIGHLAISTIDVATIVDLITGIPARTLRPCASEYCNSIFSLAMSEGLAQANPVQVARAARRLHPRDDSKDKQKQNQPRLDDVAEVRQVLLAVEASTSDPMLKLAHRLIALTLVRKMEGLGARWSEIKRDDQKGWRWVIPSRRMKQGEAHEVVLSWQAREVLEAAERLQQQLKIASPFIFARHSRLERPWSKTAINKVYARVLPKLGYAPEQVEIGTSDGTKVRTRQQHCVHGWRGSFATISAEADERSETIIERCLAHAVQNSVQKAYVHALHRRPKGALWQTWADLLMTPDVPPAGALVPSMQPVTSNVIPLRREAA
jgi:integrase